MPSDCWSEDTRGARTFGELPQKCRDYIYALETLLGRPVGLISVGPDRDETIYRYK